MNLEMIMQSWKKDSQIDNIMLDEATIKIPVLHQKYLSWRSEFSLLQKRKQHELKRIKHKKNLYFSGKATPEEYEEKPFPYKVMKSDVHGWVEVDEQVQKVEEQLEYYQTVVHTLDEILKQIHQLSFNIKNIIAWRQFTNGT